MTKGRFAIIALITGVLVGTSASQRAAAAARRTPSLLTHQLRHEVAAVEERCAARAERLDRDRRRSIATVLAVAVLLVVPAVLVTTRPGVPDAVIAVVLAAELAIAAVALLVAARLGRGGPTHGRR